MIAFVQKYVSIFNIFFDISYIENLNQNSDLYESFILMNYKFCINQNFDLGSQH